MYPRNLHLTNFKCFAEQTLNLSKITLLLGPNSSGKSSLLQGLLSIVQTDQFPLALSTNGPFADLGNFVTVAHQRDRRRQVGVALTMATDSTRQTFSGTFGRSMKNGMPEVVRAILADDHFCLNITRSARYTGTWSYDGTNDPSAETIDSVAMESFLANMVKGIESLTGQKAPSAAQKNLNGQLEAFLAPPSPSGKATFSSPGDFLKPQFLNNLRLYTRLQALGGSLKALRSRFNYIGAFRLQPERSYYQVSKGDLKILPKGENTIEQLAAWQQNEPRKLDQLIKALRGLNLLSSLKTAPIRSGLLEVRVRANAAAPHVSLPDVGFGIGQLLPILVADIQLPDGGTLAISQPEIHLHPSAQADLADHFIRGISSRKMQYIVETHSEYFLNRVRLLIAKGDLSVEDVSVIYLENNGNRTSSHEIQLLRDGRVEGAPRSFFETYMIDVMKIAMESQPA